MRKTLLLMAAGVSLSVMLAGCVMVTPMNGGLYTDLKGPVAVGSESGSSRTGTAKATAILGVAFGDASIAAGMKKVALPRLTMWIPT